MFIMYDSTDINLIPKLPHAVAYYIDGHYGVHTHEEMRARFPHAQLLPISTGSRVATECYDVEAGDYKPSEAADLFLIARDAGVTRPCFYAQLSNMQTVKDSLRPVVKARKDVRLWVADWDGTTVIPGDFDAKQFRDNALGRNLDESICHSDFFTPLSVVEQPAVKQDIVSAIISYDPDQKLWTVDASGTKVRDTV